MHISSRAPSFLPTSVRISCLLLIILADATFAVAHEVLAPPPANARWHAPSKSVTVTYLDKGDNATPTLILKKAIVLDTEISIQSDATSIRLLSGGAAGVSFNVDAGPDGLVRLKLGAGDHPALLINDKEDPSFRAKWALVATSPDRFLTVELQNATSATVKFDPSSIDAGARSAPTPSSQPSASAAEKGPDYTPDKAADAGARPEPGREMLKAATAQNLRAAATAFANGVSHQCPKCSGKGKVTVSVQDGSHRDGPLIRPTYHNEVHRCDKCNGSGHLRASDDALNRLSATFVKTLSQVNREDAKTQEAISESYKMITDSMIGDYKTWLLLTESGRSILSQSAPAPGTPVIVKVMVKEALPRVGNKRAFSVQIGGTDKIVQVLDPVTADELESGAALMGGIVDSPGGSSKPTVTLARGFLVAPPVDENWWWWYWWRPTSPRASHKETPTAGPRD